MDFTKAFDKVGHRRLIQNLDFYGMRGKTKTWIEAFLTNHTLAGEYSNMVHV